MYTNIYGDNRILIVCGKYDGLSKKYTDMLYGEIAPQIPYVLTICEADSLTDEQKSNFTLIAVGTKENNSYIAELCKENTITIPDHNEGYCIKVCDNPVNHEKQVYILAGGSDIGAYYAVSHFVNYIMPEYGEQTCYTTVPEKVGYSPCGFMFTQKIREIDITECPKIKERGIWTWGHVIYDYKRFLDNMARLRMNVITVWNDFVPLNVKEFTDYAHELGIKVIWGFSIGWDEDCDISKDNVLDEIIENAVENYRQNYIHLNSDGIYFQSFTETKADNKNGVNIAQRVAQFVIRIRKRFREEFGEIRIQFGLHASSVKEYLCYIAQIPNDIEITWEDCGSFPFAYEPSEIDDFETTLAFAENFSCLRGEKDNCSMVLKGLSTLDWRQFEHQMGTFHMGVWASRAIKARNNTKKVFWHKRNAQWLKYSDKAQKMLEMIRCKTSGETSIEYLIEDGIFEEKINLACAIAAQLAWNSSRDLSDIFYEAGLMPDVEF